FYVDVTVPEEAKSLSVRLHPLGRFQGTVYCDGLEVKKINDVTDVDDQNSLPTEYSLSQNYPNPFNPTTNIRYTLPQNSNVVLKIFDMLGREVRTLVNTQQNAGSHDVYWNGDNNFGVKVSSGTYIYMIKAGDFFEAKKMVLLK
ncbi:MAG: FlgD immunoglobulin-like domain containing protein, partial [Ignavibacteria bacterium]